MKPFLYCLLIVIFIMFENSSNAQLLSKKEFRLKESKSNLIELSKSIEPVSKRSIAKNNSPFMAGALSFVIPGAALGQLYNGQYLNFGIRLGISGIVVLGLALSGGIASDTKGNDAIVPLVILFAANWISSIIDAVIYNKKHLSGR